MGGYNDYVMMKADGTPVGGICHKQGVTRSTQADGLITLP